MLRILILLWFSFIVWPSLASENEELFKIDLGEKLFLEERFSHSFFEKSQGQINQPIAEGDPILKMLSTPGGIIQNPHRGRQISCASCHFVDQASQIKENLVFTYNDFSSRSPIPLRPDRITKTLRNSMNMVLSSLDEGQPLHWDGEFFDTGDLSCAGLTGRNMGWLIEESQLAKDNLVQVIRQDDGTYPTDSDLKNSYRMNFKALGYDIDSLSDKEVQNLTCETMGAYIKSLDFSRDSSGELNGSGYDQFLKLNDLRRGPKAGESSRDYLQYLRDNLNHKNDWKWLGKTPLQYHSHPTQFSKLEWQGMVVFFTRGQCVNCHTPPEFTDRSFHTTGLSQIEYDSVHAGGAFAKKVFPNWTERDLARQKYFTATSLHPTWMGPFAKVPEKNHPDFLDLGAWNVLGHPDKASVQKQLKERLCFSASLPHCNDWNRDRYLQKSLAAFKTPTLRSLGQSAPYFHNGSGKDLNHVLQIYLASSHMAKTGAMVNADPMLKAIQITPQDFAAMIAFLNSLDEDYD